ncbi:MAG: isoprenyl transferase [Desulfotalea sp.]
MEEIEITKKYQLDPKRIPNHIAIIMDGNGRWAISRNRPRLFGHKAGADSVHDIVTFCCELGIKALTLYAFSSENWNRPKLEVAGLMSILQTYLKAELPKMIENNIRLHCIGDIESLPKGVSDSVKHAMGKTANNDGLILSLALSYGSRDEICRAIKNVGQDLEEGKIVLDDITPDKFSAYLDTSITPELDLLIRTGGERRLSNFLLWQISYAEMIFSDIMWPDFRRDQLANAIKDFQYRERRFGQTSAQLIE